MLESLIIGCGSSAVADLMQNTLMQRDLTLTLYTKISNAICHIRTFDWDGTEQGWAYK